MLRIVCVYVLSIQSLPILGQGFFISDYYALDDEYSLQQVWDIKQDTNQYIYVGHSKGTAIYYGTKWNFLHIGESGRTKTHHLTNHGEMLVSGFQDYGLLEADSLNTITFKSLSEPSFLSSNEHTIIRSLNGIFFYIGYEGLNVISDSENQFYPIENMDFSIGELIGDRFRIYTSNKLYEYANSQLVSSQNVLSLKPTYTFALKLLDNAIILGSTNDGLFMDDSINLYKINTVIDSYLENSFPYHAVKLKKDVIAIATLDSGFVILDMEKDQAEIYQGENYLHDDQILSLFYDHEQTLWIGQNEGIQKLLIDYPVYQYGKQHGLDEYLLKVIALGETILVKSFDNVLEISTKNNSIQETSITYANAMLKLDNEAYVHTDDTLFVINQNGNIIQFDNVDGIIQNFDEASVEFVSGDMITSIDSKLLETIDSLSMISFDQGIKFDGEYFFLSSRELSTLHKGKLTQVQFSDSITGSRLFNHLGLIDGALHLGVESSNNDRGLYVYNTVSKKFEIASDFKPFDENLITKQVVTFEQCSNKDVWFENNKKIKRLKWLGEKYIVQTSPFQLFGGKGSIYDIECADDGTVWFAGTEGLFHLTDPDWEYTSTFKTNITGVFVDQDSLIYGGFGEPVKPLVLPYEDNQLRFTYAAASYVDESRNTYSYKLEGFDATWSDFSPETQKDYTNIPEGDYIFKVRSRNVFEVAGFEDSISFTILPPWYRTWWAYLLYVIGISGLIYTAHRIRLNQLLKVERMRTKIASDLHDEVSATLTGISYFAEAVKTDKDEHRKSHFINLITESAGDAKEKITDIVWSITPENDNWELFLSKCRRYASDLLESSEIKYNLNITETIDGALSMNVRQHLWMIFKEMLTNTVRHSQASQLDVILDVEDGVLKLIVQDNGKGFDVDSDRMGNGVSNIKKRANEIGADIDLISEPEMGSRWRLELKL